MYKCNKVAIAEMVAKLDSLEREYSPHMVSVQPACSLPEVEQGISLDPVEQADVSGPEQEEESAIGSPRGAGCWSPADGWRTRSPPW